MRRTLTLLLIIAIAFAAKVDVRIVTTSPNPQESQAYVALLTFVKERPQALAYVPSPSQWSVGAAVTSPPNPKVFKGILLVFDNDASTGNITRDKQLANAYVYNVILPALENGMRVALIVGPYSNIGQLVLYRLGLLIPTVPVNESGKFVPAPSCLSGVKPLQPSPELHQIYSNISALPASCCMVPIVPDVVAPASLGAKGKYCVVIRLTKLGDEIVIMSWKGIFRDISTNPNVQELLLNTLKYLAGYMPAKYPKTPYTVTKTVTTTTATTVTLTNNVTIIMTYTTTSTVTVSTTVTQIYTTTLTTTIFMTITKYINMTKVLTTTLYNTITSTVTQVVTTTINNTVTYTTTLLSTVVTTLTKTVFNTVTTTTTIVKKEANAAMIGGAFVGGLIVGIIVIAIVTGRSSRGKAKSALEEW